MKKLLITIIIFGFNSTVIFCFQNLDLDKVVKIDTINYYQFDGFYFSLQNAFFDKIQVNKLMDKLGASTISDPYLFSIGAKVKISFEKDFSILGEIYYSGFPKINKNIYSVKTNKILGNNDTALKNTNTQINTSLLNATIIFPYKLLNNFNILALFSGNMQFLDFYFFQNNKNYIDNVKLNGLKIENLSVSVSLGLGLEYKVNLSNTKGTYFQVDDKHTILRKWEQETKTNLIFGFRFFKTLYSYNTWSGIEEINKDYTEISNGFTYKFIIGYNFDLNSITEIYKY